MPVPAFLHVSHAKAGSTWIDQILRALFGPQVAPRFGSDLTQLKLPAAMLTDKVRVQGKLIDNALFFPDRRPEFVTQGLRAIKSDPASTDILAKDTMRTKQFFDQSTSNGNFRQGFVSALDGTPHGSVHVRVGTEEGAGMGSFDEPPLALGLRQLSHNRSILA